MIDVEDKTTGRVERRSFGFAPTILDDRTPPRQVPLWRPERDFLKSRPPWRERFEKDLDPYMKVRFLQRIGRYEVIVLAVMVIPACVLLAFIWLMGWHPWVNRLIFAVGMLSSLWILRYLAFCRVRQKVRAALLETHTCASCGYDLASLPATPDGLTTCPECDAAWRLSAVS